MQVVHVNEVAHVAAGLVAGLAAAGHQASLVDPPKPGATMPYPWKVTTIPLRLAILAGTAVIVRREAPDLVHVHYASQAVVGALIGRPFVVHCHGSDIRNVDPWTARGRYLARVMAPAAAVIYSTPDLETAVRRFRPDAEFLPNPVDTDQFAPRGSSQRDILVAIRLDAAKGATEVMAGLRLVLARRPETTATVVAFGPLAHELARDLGPRVCVQHTVPHDAMPRLIGDHRVAIGQLGLGAFGMTELETMSCGVPVVTDYRFARSYSVPPPVVQADRPATVADGLVQLLDDRDLRERAAADSRAWVVRHHSLPVVTRRLLATYDRVLARAAAGRA